MILSKKHGTVINAKNMLISKKIFDIVSFLIFLFDKPYKKSKIYLFTVEVIT